MIRCPSCGKRLKDGAPNCVTHGAPPPAAPAAEDASTPFVVPTPELAAFRVKKLLGQGGFGAVFLAERISDGQPCAVKVARADNASAGDSARCGRGSRGAPWPLRRPHVPAVYDSGKLPNGSVYVVMDFVTAPILADVMTALDGFDAARGLRARRRSPSPRSWRSPHGKGLVHCDLKPENVFVHESFGAKLFDFGLVRQVSTGAKVEQTKEEAPAGTPEYMSPEQCEGRSDIDARSDLYALGVIFYEMLAGGLPFWGKANDIQQSHRSRRPPALGRRVPMAVPLEDAIMRCSSPGRSRAAPGELRDPELRKALQAGIIAERARRAGGGVAVVAAAPAPDADAAKPAAGGWSSRRRPRASAAPSRSLFFESKSPVADVREAMNGVGAQLANAAGAQYVLAFGHEIGDNARRAPRRPPARCSWAAACARAPSSTWRRSRSRRAPTARAATRARSFAKKEQYPGDADPGGRAALGRRRRGAARRAHRATWPARPGRDAAQEGHAGLRRRRRRAWACRRRSWGATSSLRTLLGVDARGDPLRHRVRPRRS